MKKYSLLIVIMVLAALLTGPGCKALGTDDNEEDINVVGTWIFTNVLKTNQNEVHTRTFILTGNKDAGTVSEKISVDLTGTYTVTGNQFRMDIENHDNVYRWTYNYEGVIQNKNDMSSGTMITTTYPAAGGNAIAVFEYTFTAKRSN